MIDYALPIRDLVDEVDIPGNLVSAVHGFTSLLNDVYYLDYELTTSETAAIFEIELLINGEANLGIPGLSDFEFLFSSLGNINITYFVLKVIWEQDRFRIELNDINLGLRFPRTIFKPMFGSGKSEIRFAGNIIYDSEARLTLEGFDTFTLTDTVFVPTDTAIRVATGKVDFFGDEWCFALSWKTADINSLLSSVSGGVGSSNHTIEADVSIGVVLANPSYGDVSLKQARVDWVIDNNDNSDIALPGSIKLSLPNRQVFSLIVGAGAKADFSRVMFGYTALGSEGFSLSGGMSWVRGNEREVINEQEQDDIEPLFMLEAAPRKEGNEDASAKTIILLDVDLSEPSFPTLFQTTPTPLLSSLTSLCQPIGRLDPLDFEEWILTFSLNLLKDNSDIFRLPFLNEHVQIFMPDGFEPKLTGELIKFPIGIRVFISDLQLNTIAHVSFDLKTFALDIPHTTGLRLLGNAETLLDDKNNELWGMRWNFFGKKIDNENDPDHGKFHFFTLVTDKYNYQIQMPDGARIDLAFRELSEEPLIFRTTNFVLNEAGVSLTTEVVERPTTLNGIQTQFNFGGSALEIVDNRLKSFTLAGSGPLPPDLVGEATAEIALEFGRNEQNTLYLKQGYASVDPKKPLVCGGTRFQFSLDKIGLKFVSDSRYHLYFTLTGTARFVLNQGEHADGVLALLPTIEIRLNECPLTTDMSVIAQHVDFLIDLPKPVSFDVLGCFDMEIRAIGFIPQAHEFDGLAAMQLSGQVKFAAGEGDAKTDQRDYHTLLIGLPRPGQLFPQVYFRRLSLSIGLGSAFKLSGAVEFVDEKNKEGFKGSATLQIKGLPSISAAVGFLRIRTSPTARWVRAWFIYVELGDLSLGVPLIPIYLREIGLGFGYRYTLVSIKAADRENDVRKLLGELKSLSRTQANLTDFNNWDVDLERANEDPRWTIVLRGLLTMTTATPGTLYFDQTAERELANLFMFDAILALRSDLTFFMAARGWLNSNYADFRNNVDNTRNKPLFSGFIIYSPRRKRLLANVSSNPDGKVGKHPDVSSLVRDAIESAEFSATLLIEPGLVHYELGWPNMLRWKTKLGPLEVDIRGGYIFRASRRELVMGASLLARGSLRIEAGFSAGVAGVSISAYASIAYGARYIGVLAFKDTKARSAYYQGIGLDFVCRISIRFWIKLLIAKKRFRLSVSISFSGFLELGVPLNRLPGGVRARGTISLKAMGRRLRFSVGLGINEGAVIEARRRVEPFLNVGLEAADVEPLPGTTQSQQEFAALDKAAQLPTLEAKSFTNAELPSRALTAGSEPGHLEAAKSTPNSFEFFVPNYSIFVVTKMVDGEQVHYFCLMPAGEADASGVPERGFLPVPPKDVIASDSPDFKDFKLSLPNDSTNSYRFEQFDPIEADWVTRTLSATNDVQWKSNWRASILEGNEKPSIDEPESQLVMLKLYAYLRYAFVTDTLEPVNFTNVPADTPNERLDRSEIYGSVVPLGDPDVMSANETLNETRVQNHADAAYESVVTGALEQFRGSPHFKRDPNSPYEQQLEAAFAESTSIYSPTGRIPQLVDYANGNEAPGLMLKAISEYAKRLHQSSLNEYENGLQDVVEPIYQWPRIRVINLVQSDPQFQLFLSGIIAAWDAFVEDVKAMKIAERVDQMRSLIIQDIISDLRDYAEATTKEHQDTIMARSLAFQMGLVFRAHGEMLPWLEHNNGEAVQIQQRKGIEAKDVSTEIKHIRTFNISATNFATNPPRFEDVVPLTDASTVAIAWKLKWASKPADNCTAGQADPEHHVRHYVIKRQPLGNTREQSASFIVDAAESANRTRDGIINLRPRYQFVDNFSHETVAEQAALPAEGRSYLYTITPVDQGNNLGRPLTLVATRFPTEPPQVPTDTTLVVTYKVETNTEGDQMTTPPLARPTANLAVSWASPQPRRDGVHVPIRTYRIIFRRTKTLPIGSYGIDAETQGDSAKSMPSSFGRIRPNDIVVDVTVSKEKDNKRNGEITVEELETKGIYPRDSQWRPEAWQVFMQTVSDAGVPSALAPVQVKLNFTAESAEIEERELPELEWLPIPTRLPLLPAEDMDAVVENAHFPMPSLAQLSFNGNLNNVSYQPHPLGIRCIRLRWNQAPSENPNYPLALHAGFNLYQLDVDVNTVATFNDPLRLAEEVKQIQEVRLMPAEDLPLIPSDTLAVNEWEAWYPSELSRRAIHAANPTNEDTTIGLSSWFSWRDSTLIWPPNPPEQPPDANGIRMAFHPTLYAILAALGERYVVDQQSSPPRQPLDLATFFANTSPEYDPYGWNVLQQFGLSVAFTLRVEGTGELVSQAEMLRELDDVLSTLSGEHLHQPLFKHLHIELLIQPSRRVSLKANTVAKADDLLALVQVSLRPIPTQGWYYTEVTIEGEPGASSTLRIENLDGVCSIIDLDQVIAHQEDVEKDGEREATYPVFIPSSGQVRLLLRRSGSLTSENGELKLCDNLPERCDPPMGLTLSQQSRQVTFGHTSKFIVIEQLVDDFSVDNGNDAWDTFAWYAESLNARTEEAAKIKVPRDSAEIEKILPIYLAWTQRFFDYSIVPSHTELPNAPAPPTTGPWLVTAYPRINSPAYATPDESGRLTYDQLLGDKWAHTYRHFVQPYGRYDRMWQGMQSSPMLFDKPVGESEKRPKINTENPALDIVLDRVHPVEAPLVLSSRRLDMPVAPGTAATPGKVWEVLIAKHPEQALREHNQSLVRQLDFHGIAHTMRRRFAYMRLLQTLHHIEDGETVEAVLNQNAETPSSIMLDHIETSEPLDANTAYEIDLTTRLQTFQEGAIGIQWEALPFYYHHQLLLVASAGKIVSKTNEIVQYDFEYIAPQVHNLSVQGVLYDDRRERQLMLPLLRLWDSLPPEVQERWPHEDPDSQENEVRILPGSLPDPEIVYQIVEQTFGNVEVLAEIYNEWSADDEKPVFNFKVRHLGERLKVTLSPEVRRPEPGLSYQLPIILQTGEQNRWPIDAICTAPIGETIGELPVELIDRASVSQDERGLLVWHGDGTEALVNDLRNLEGDSTFLAAIGRLITQIEEDKTFVIEHFPLPPNLLPPAQILPETVTFNSETITWQMHDQATLTIEQDDISYQTLVWQGFLFDDTIPFLLRDWAQLPELRGALELLLAQLEGQEIEIALRPSIPATLPLTIAGDTMQWTGDSPDDAERQLIAQWATDFPTFHRRVDELFTQITGVNVNAPIPADAEIPIELTDSIVAETINGESHWRWQGNLPTTEEHAILDMLAAGDEVSFADGIKALLAELDALRQVTLQPFGQEQLPTDVINQLTFSDTHVRWSGRLLSETQLTVLNQITFNHEEIADAVGQLAIQLGEPPSPEPITLNIPKRTAPSMWSSALRDHLLLSYQSIRFTGVMTESDRESLASALPNDEVYKAITHQLARDSLNKGLEKSRLSVRVRRGSADPSDLTPFLGGQL